MADADDVDLVGRLDRLDDRVGEFIRSMGRQMAALERRLAELYDRVEPKA